MSSVSPKRPAASALGYRRREPERTALYQTVEATLPRLEATLRSGEVATPTFVQREFHDYLACGRLEHGFVRVKCDGCRHEHLVAFSCKRRGFCPSCGARRMVETSAHLVDRVFPDVPVRQWVLSFPYPLRFLFASRPEALARCLAVIPRAIETDLIQRAGLTRASGARTGAVTVVQRFGSALNLNVHLHMLILDGVYTFEHGTVRFHEVGAPPPDSLERLTAQVVQRVYRRLVADGWLIEDPEQSWLDLEETDALDALRAASIRYRVALGPSAGRRISTLVDRARARPAAVKPFTVDQDGFSLNAAVACPAGSRERLERLCRDVTRPAIALERLSLNRCGEVLLALKRPFRDGTTHLKFTPEDFLARLAALVPRPRANLTRYHGVFAPAHPWRSQVTGTVREAAPAGSGNEQAEKGRCPRGHDRGADTGDEIHPPPEMASVPTAPLTWAQRLRRVFGIEITMCPHCGGRLRVIADVTDPEVMERILEHVRREGLPRAPPARSTVV
jgi:ribosomal protein S27E